MLLFYIFYSRIAIYWMRVSNPNNISIQGYLRVTFSNLISWLFKQMVEGATWIS